MWKKILIGGVVVLLVGLATGGVALVIGVPLTAALGAAGIAASGTAGAMAVKDHMNQKEIEKYKKEIQKIVVDNEERKQYNQELNVTVKKLSIDYQTTCELLSKLNVQFEEEHKQHEQELKSLNAEKEKLQREILSKRDDEAEAKWDSELVGEDDEIPGLLAAYTKR